MKERKEERKRELDVTFNHSFYAQEPCKIVFLHANASRTHIQTLKKKVKKKIVLYCLYSNYHFASTETFPHSRGGLPTITITLANLYFPSPYMLSRAPEIYLLFSTYMSQSPSLLIFFISKNFSPLPSFSTSSYLKINHLSFLCIQFLY